MDRARKSNGVVSMRLFANWDIDKTGNDIVQRVANFSVNRLQLRTLAPELQSIVITARLQGHKRNLRSNEIALPARTGQLDLPLDISFAIQYPHFLKRKINVLQILIQRRRRYKNRPIPGGFKTLAIGLVNLTQLLQQGQLHEILLWNSDDLQKENTANVQSIGRLNFSVCATQPLDSDTGPPKGKPLGELSEDSDSETDDEAEAPADSDHHDAPSTANPPGKRMGGDRRKFAHRKNLKQRIVSLLKKFKVPEEEETNFPPSTSASVARAPTAKELEALFEELDDLSDSGPEGMLGDDISIDSIPRPNLQPYFSRERIPALASIDDEKCSDSENEENEWSSGEREGRKETTTSYVDNDTPRRPQKPNKTVQPTLSDAKIGPSASRTTISHSLTAGSIATTTTPLARDSKTQRNASFGDHILSPETPFIRDFGECVWLFHPSDLPLQLPSAVRAVPCTTVQNVRAVLGQLVQKLHNFCNSNSNSPPLTWIGVLGGDRLISFVLRSYVELVAHRSSTPFLASIRFALVPPPHSLCGRLISGIDSVLDALCHDVWERSAEMSPAEIQRLNAQLDAWAKNLTAGCIHLPIGEALLQMPEKEGQSIDSTRLFVPFLAEVRVGQNDPEDLPETVSSPRDIDKEPASTSSAFVSGSPPASPQNRHETQEMQVEYWTDPHQQEPGSHAPGHAPVAQTPPKKEGKGSLKSTFRTLLVTRTCAQPLLALTFVKEKRKEKMLQKLGMKNRQKSEAENPPVQVTNVSRLLCSGAQKHSQLAVCVDGQTFPSVRFFQTSSQWPTHIRTLPVSIISSLPNFYK
ncbi:unnamed protein product, partial [Mesorhabditis spiculigera]